MRWRSKRAPWTRMSTGCARRSSATRKSRTTSTPFPVSATASSPTKRDPARRALTARLSRAGFIAAEEEADELLACAGGDTYRLDALVGRRLAGEPLAWIIGRVSFCGLEIRVDPGVYVPRWQSELLARR